MAVGPLFRPAIFTSALCLLLAAVSCGPSKEEAALERIKNRKPPGSIRLINLAEEPAQLLVDGKPIGTNIAPGSAGPFVPVPAGKHDITATTGQGSTEAISREFGNREVQSAVLFQSGGKQALQAIKGEPRSTNGSGARIAGVLVSTKNAETAKVTIGGLSAGTLKPWEPSLLTAVVVGPADIKVSLGGKSASVDGRLETGSDYTLLAFPKGSGWSAILIRNSGERPQMAGSAPG